MPDRPTIEADTLILGAGLTGLTVAQGLRRAGRTAAVLDKSRGLGGRLATRRAGDLRFDHGAQYLRPRGAGFAAFLDALTLPGAAAAWDAPPGDAAAFVGCPGMSGLVRPLATGVTVHRGVRIAAARREGGTWALRDADGALRGRARRLVCAIPAPQAAQVLDGHAFAPRIGRVAMDPCWTLMAAFDARPDLPDAAREVGGAIGWVARDGGKPGRTGETWVAQASAGWTRAHLDMPRDAAARALLDRLRDTAGGALPTAVHLDAHRWLHAQAAAPLGAPCLHDPGAGLVVAGDWCLGARAEDAFDSAQAALVALGVAAT